MQNNDSTPLPEAPQGDGANLPPAPDLVAQGFAPGWYTCTCRRCQVMFLGHKRAWTCHLCARIQALDPGEVVDHWPSQSLNAKSGEWANIVEVGKPATNPSAWAALSKLGTDEGIAETWKEFADSADWDDAVEAIAPAFGEEELDTFHGCADAFGEICFKGGLLAALKMVPSGPDPLPTNPSAEGVDYLRDYPANAEGLAPHQKPDAARYAMAQFLSQTTFGQATNPGKWESYDLNRRDFWNYVAYKAIAASRAAALLSAIPPVIPAPKLDRCPDCETLPCACLIDPYVPAPVIPENSPAPKKCGNDGSGMLGRCMSCYPAPTESDHAIGDEEETADLHMQWASDGDDLEKSFNELHAYAKKLEAKLAPAPSTREPERARIPEDILRAADVVIAYPEDYEGYALMLAKYLRDSWPSTPAPEGVAPKVPSPEEKP